MKGAQPIQPPILWIIWLAAISSLFFYAVAPLFLPAAESALSPTFRIIVIITMVVAAVLLTFVATLLYKIGIVRSFARGEIDLDSPDGVRLVLVRFVLVWATVESIGVLGLVTFLLFREPFYLYPFLLVAFGFLVLYSPRLDRLRGQGGSADLAHPDIKID